MKVKIFIIIWTLVSACTSPKELTVFTKKSVDLNEPTQVGVILNFKPTKFKLKENNSYRIIEEPRIVKYNKESNTYLLRYVIQPIESGSHYIPKCMIFNRNNKYTTKDYDLDISENLFDSTLSKIIMNDIIKLKMDESNTEETKPIYIRNKLDKLQYEFGDTIKIKYESDEFEFDYFKLIDLRRFKIESGPIFKSHTEISNGVITKINSVTFNLLSTNRGEQTIPNIDTTINGRKIIADEIKIMIK